MRKAMPLGLFLLLMACSSPPSASPHYVLVSQAGSSTVAVVDPIQNRTVSFQPNNLETTDTNLRVVVTPLDPTKDDAALPGDLIAGGASPTPLGAVTFAEFSILDSQNRRINLKPGSSAIVELPIPPELRSQYKIGDKIHCYAYNPQNSRWTVMLNAFSGALSGGDLDITDNITGIGMQGNTVSA